MDKYDVINMHFIDICNFDCIYCYANNNQGGVKSQEKWERIIDDIAIYFKENNISTGRINLVGGEPLLYKKLPEIIDYICDKNIKVSILTNGYYLNEEFIKKVAKKVSMIGLSIDSILHKTNIKIGRCERNKTLSLDEVVKRAEIIKKYGIIFKLNVVISKLNINEDFERLFKLVKPDRLKFLQLYIIDSVNKKSQYLKVTDQEFKEFSKRYSKYKPVIESNNELSLGYIMIDSKGDFFINDKNKYIILGNVFREKFKNIIKKIPYELKNFNLRHKTSEYGLILGDFQILHKGYEKLIIQTSKYVRNLIIGITNFDLRGDNFFEYIQRYEMIKFILKENDIYNYTILPFSLENIKSESKLSKNIILYQSSNYKLKFKESEKLKQIGFKIKNIENDEIFIDEKRLLEMIKVNDNNWKNYVSEEIVKKIEKRNTL